MTDSVAKRRLSWPTRRERIRVWSRLPVVHFLLIGGLSWAALAEDAGPIRQETVALRSGELASLGELALHGGHVDEMRL